MEYVTAIIGERKIAYGSRGNRFENIHLAGDTVGGGDGGGV